jgi:hypothetical protein
MADFRAIVAVCDAVLRLLQTSYQPEDFNNDLEFKSCRAEDLNQPVTAGVTLFLYRILHNGNHRTPRGRIGVDGRRYRPQLPVDLHFLLTAWGEDASLQQTIAGWMMRTLEDTPILPAGLLNATAPGVFRPDEAVEIALAELNTEDLLHIWETVTENRYQLSVPYVARNVRIESTQPITTGPPIQERELDYRVPEG